jgi:hypothetical protein
MLLVQQDLRVQRVVQYLLQEDQVVQHHGTLELVPQLAVQVELLQQQDPRQQVVLEVQVLVAL